MRKYLFALIIVVYLSHTAMAAVDYMSPPIPVAVYPKGSPEQIQLSDWFGEVFIEMAMQTQEGKIIGEDMLRSLTADDDIIIMEDLRDLIGAVGARKRNGEMALQLTNYHKGMINIMIHEKCHSVTAAIIEDAGGLCEGYATLLQSKISGKFEMYIGMPANYMQQCKELEWLEGMVGSEEFWRLSVRRGGIDEIARIFESRQNIITFDQFENLSSTSFIVGKEDGPYEFVKYLVMYMNMRGCLNYISQYPVFDKNDPVHGAINRYYSSDLNNIDQNIDILSSAFEDKADRINVLYKKQLVYARQKGIYVNEGKYEKISEEYNEKYRYGDTKIFAFTFESPFTYKSNEEILKTMLDDCYVSRATGALEASEAQRVYLDLKRFYELHIWEIKSATYADEIYRDALSKIRKNIIQRRRVGKPRLFFEAN